MLRLAGQARPSLSAKDGKEEEEVEGGGRESSLGGEEGGKVKSAGEIRDESEWGVGRKEK